MKDNEDYDKNIGLLSLGGLHLSPCILRSHNLYLQRKLCTLTCCLIWPDAFYKIMFWLPALTVQIEPVVSNWQELLCCSGHSAAPALSLKASDRPRHHSSLKAKLSGATYEVWKRPKGELAHAMLPSDFGRLFWGGAMLSKSSQKWQPQAGPWARSKGREMYSITSPLQSICPIYVQCFQWYPATHCLWSKPLKLKVGHHHCLSAELYQ